MKTLVIVLIIVSVAALTISLICLKMLTNLRKNLEYALSELSEDLEIIKEMIQHIIRKFENVPEKDFFEDSDTKIKKIYRTIGYIHRNLSQKKKNIIMDSSSE